LGSGQSFWAGRRERWKYSKRTRLVNLVNDTNNVVAKNFQQQFVPSRDFGFAANNLTELPLDRGKRGFDVRPAVVLREEFFFVKFEEMKQAIPIADSNWETAIRDAQGRLAALNVQRRKLEKAIRLMRRQIKDGAPWPMPKIEATTSNDKA
jgi:hypothetical protein